jgi:signal transduction histidine kinase
LKLRRVSVSYRNIVEKALLVLNDKLKEQKVTVRLEIPDDLPLLYCDQELLRNCLFNFITNGAQSMADGGTLTIGAVHADNMFRLSFTDQGSGIPAEDLEKIFQPYFTTKEAGIGLGLAITERIIKEHGGEITVESTVGSGTTITVSLPQQEI